MVSHQTPSAADVAILRNAGATAVLGTRGGYGDFSHIERYLESIRWLRNQGLDFDWLINLSGQDYPLVHLETAERELAATDADGLLEIWRVFSAEGHWKPRVSHTRYGFRYRHVPVTSRAGRGAMQAASALNRVQPWVRISAHYRRVGVRQRMPFGGGFDCYGGSFFANLSAVAIAEIESFCAARPDMVEWFQGVLAPEEVFFQTILGNSANIRLLPDAKRYFDFRTSTTNHPKDLTLDDLSRMVSSGAWFARKFPTHGRGALLDHLDDRAQGRTVA